MYYQSHSDSGELSSCLITLVFFISYVICLGGITPHQTMIVSAQQDDDVAGIFVMDPVTEALEYVETIEQQRHNCSFGPTLNLQYSKDRWLEEAKITVRTANFLTFLSRTGDHILGSHLDDVNMLYSLVRANVDNYDKVFGSAIAFDTNLYLDYNIFCPYAFISPDGIVQAKDLSIGYDYHDNRTDWFWVPYQQFYNYSYEEPNLNISGRDTEDQRLFTIGNGYWTQPYFDCGGGDVWMVTFSMPFFTNAYQFNTSQRNSSEESDYIFAGVTTIDLVLDDLDINQCPRDQNAAVDDNVFDPFINTHKCHNTTKCVHLPNQGFKRGTYRCQCHRGYYFPDVSANYKSFNGTEVEEEYSKMLRGQPNQYSSFICLQCSQGCDDCVDDSQCVLETNYILRFALSMVQCVFIAGLLGLAIYTFLLRENKVIKAASPGLLYVFLLGAAISYCQIIADGLLSVEIACILLPWLNYIGFSLAYGAVLFKTWRIIVVFKVRSAKPIRITDKNLYLRIILLVAIVSIFLGAWTVFATPKKVTYYTQSGLKYTHCSRTFWTYIGEAGELLLLAWGVYLCVKVRKAPSAFNEAKYISISIYNETIMALFSFAFVFVLPVLNGGADIFFVADFCTIHVSITVMVGLLFGSKMYHVYNNTERFSNTKGVSHGANNNRQTTGNGMVNTVDTINAPTVDFVITNPDVQAEVSRMKEVLQEITDAMQLAGIKFSATKMRKRPEINQGYNSKDETTTPPSSISGSRDNFDIQMEPDSTKV